MTPTELKYAAARETGVVGILETPSAEQGQILDERYEALHAQLMDDGIASWAIAEDIPDKMAQPMIWALAFIVAGPFGAPPEIVANLAAIGAYGTGRPTLAEKQLRQYSAQKYVPQPIATEYY